MQEDIGNIELKSLKLAYLIGSFAYGQETEELCKEHLEELERLCDTYGLNVVGKIVCPLRKMDAATFLGKGKIEEIQKEVLSLGAEVLIFDHEISPNQQRNLEKLFNKVVIDRTELILEVFADRAQTKEARLQISLATMRYQMPRLKRLWTHLSRQAGTGGKSGAYLKGEGEKQIEIDRRLVRRRIDQLNSEIEEVKRHRMTQRSARLRSQIPTFAIVGYTNSGKSTLLHALTQAEVLIEDKLFATLDTTARKFTLPNKQEILLIDTVGFIRKIPHLLIAAFKSTLEESLFTDVLLHVVDVSHPSAEEQAEETMKVLKELEALDRPIITVLNKVDLCKDPNRVRKFQIKYPKTVAISALEGSNFSQLLELMMETIQELRKRVSLRIPQSHYGLVNEILVRGKIFSQEYEDNDILLEAEIPKIMEHKIAPFVARGHYGKDEI